MPTTLAQLPADTHIIDWFEEKGIAFVMCPISLGGVDGLNFPQRSTQRIRTKSDADAVLLNFDASWPAPRNLAQAEC